MLCFARPAPLLAYWDCPVARTKNWHSTARAASRANSAGSAGEKNGARRPPGLLNRSLKNKGRAKFVRGQPTVPHTKLREKRMGFAMLAPHSVQPHFFGAALTHANEQDKRQLTKIIFHGKHPITEKRKRNSRHHVDHSAEG